jgi:hypothetical protein
MNKIPFNAEAQRTRRSAEMSRVIWIFSAVGNLFLFREPLGSAGFQTCCIADFPVGRTSGSCASSGFGNPRYSRLGSLRYFGCGFAAPSLCVSAANLSPNRP